MRRIVHIIDNLNLGGGAQRFLSSYLSNLNPDSLDHHTVIALYSSDAEYRNFSHHFQKIERLSFFRLNPLIPFNLICRAFKIKADIFHLHLEISTCMAPILKLFSRNSKIVASIYMTRAAAPAWAYPLFAAIQNCVDKFICNSDELTDIGISDAKVCKELKVPIDIKSIVVLPKASNPVFKRHGLNHDDLILLSVGRLHPDKQHDLIVRAMPDLIQKNKRIKLIILGIGPEQKKLLQLVGNLRISESVILAGFQYDVDSYYSAASIYLRSSRNEGTNLSVLRAMAFKLPIIANLNNSPCECIRDKVNGRKIDFRNQSEITTSVLNMLFETETALRYGATAAADVEEYGMKQCLEGIQNIYDEIIT